MAIFLRRLKAVTPKDVEASSSFRVNPKVHEFIQNYKMNFQWSVWLIHDDDASSNVHYNFFKSYSTDRLTCRWVCCWCWCFFFASKIRRKQNRGNKLWQLSVKILRIVCKALARHSFGLILYTSDSFQHSL